MGLGLKVADRVDLPVSGVRRRLLLYAGRFTFTAMLCAQKEYQSDRIGCMCVVIQDQSSTARSPAVTPVTSFRTKRPWLTMRCSGESPSDPVALRPPPDRLLVGLGHAQIILVIDSGAACHACVLSRRTEVWAAGGSAAPSRQTRRAQVNLRASSGVLCTGAH